MIAGVIYILLLGVDIILAQRDPRNAIEIKRFLENSFGNQLGLIIYSAFPVITLTSVVFWYIMKRDERSRRSNK